MVFVPAFAFGSGLQSTAEPGHAAVFFGGIVLAAIAIVVHVRLSEAHPGLVVATIAVAAALVLPAAFGVFILVLIGGGCGDDEGHIPQLAWALAAVLYLAGAVWGLQRPLRTLWAAPVSLLAAGILLVAIAVVFTGSTGACLE